MPGARQSAAMLELNGTAHRSQAEIEERREQEPLIPIPDRAEPPKWLNKKHHAEFRRIGEILLAAGLYTELDRDTLGQYFAAFEQWLLATRKLGAAMRRGGDAKEREAAREEAKAWSSIQSNAFRQARQCADSMGLSVTSRCRLIVPQALRDAAAAAGEDKGDDFGTRLAARQARALEGGGA